MKTNKINLIASLILVIFLSMSCNNPTDPSPTSGTISGIVSFPITSGTISDAWPVGQVSIGMYLTWPPQGAPADTTNIAVADLDESNQYHYTFDNVVFETYPGIAVSWLDPEDTSPFTQNHALGAYGATSQPSFEDATSITVSAENHEQLNLDFIAYLTLAVP